MDKQTLSNYGWLVIVTLILAVMLAFATPFGTYVGDGVVSIANGFVGASDQAIDEDNIKTNGEKWDSKFDYSVLNNKNEEMFSGIIFESSLPLNFPNCHQYPHDCTEECYTKVQMKITWDELKTGNYEVEMNEYKYLANAGFQVGPYFSVPNITDKEVSGMNVCEGLIKLYVPNGMNVIGEYAFNGNSNLEYVMLPNSITNIEMSAFEGCTKLTEIHYNGTKEQWNKIELAIYDESDWQISWNGNSAITKIICTDGTIEL